MENTNPNAPLKGQKINESVIITGVSYMNPKDGDRKVVLHTTKCKVMKTREGQSVERFTFTVKQWNNFVKASGKPEFIYNKQILGGKYNIESKFVEAGDAFLVGEGTYSKAHFARISESLVMSNTAQAEDTRLATQAYYAFEVSRGSHDEVAPVAIVASSNEDSGDDIAA